MPSSLIRQVFRSFPGAAEPFMDDDSYQQPSSVEGDDGEDEDVGDGDDSTTPRPNYPLRVVTASRRSSLDYSESSEDFEHGNNGRYSTSSSSMRIVRFNNSNNKSSSSNDADGDIDEADDSGDRRRKSNQRQLQLQPSRRSPPPPPSAFKSSPLDMNNGTTLKLGRRYKTNTEPTETRRHHHHAAAAAETHAEHNNKDAAARKTHRKQHIHPSHNKSPDWMAQLAYSFRSPSPQHQHKSSLSHSSSSQGLSAASNDIIEYTSCTPLDYFGSMSSINATATGGELKFSAFKKENLKQEQAGAEATSFQKNSLDDGLVDESFLGEGSPLLGGGGGNRRSTNSYHRSGSSNISERSSGASTSGVFFTNRSNATENYVALAASFLRDYEAGRAPTLSTNLREVTDRQLRLFEFKFGGYAFPICMFMASAAFFASSMLEGFDLPTESTHYLTCLNFIGLSVFLMDVWFRYQLRGSSSRTEHTRDSRSERLVKPLILFAIILAVENVARVSVTPNDHQSNNSVVLFSSLFKPLVLFYASSKARDALEALRRILRIVIRVLVMELLLILMFAAVACRLFQEFHTFENLSTSWLSLFQLSTTVVNPSIWMPVYRQEPFAAIFFITFIVTSVFYLHSLVLSVVFSTYVQAAAEIHERSSGDREDAIQMAFVALQQQDKGNLISIDLVRDTLRVVRPHYNAMKINALVEIVDPSDQRVVDFATFRTKIRQALNASIRTARSATTLATLVELIAVVIAVVNFSYVIMVSSRFHAPWFDSIQEAVGAVITLVASFELLVRFNPLRIPDFTPLTRLNATFDGLALVGAVTSIVGIILYAIGFDHAIEYILIGRAIDMIRIMRFFQIFRDVVRRSSDVMPALVGPVVLVITTLHIFVYLGMALWGGAIKVGQHFGEIDYLYDLNNFNSYAEGAVTMFQVLVVNDWNAIAEVFLFADRLSSPVVVYPFFILGNLIGVSIMLNVLTAFFVETFVTKLDDGTIGHAEATTTVQKDRDFNIATGEKRAIRRVASNGTLNRRDEKQQDAIDRGADADSEASSEDLYEFDVYEREGFDKIMETVSGNSQHHDFAQQMFNYLEIFETLTPGREKVGYLICDQRTLERIGNQHFQSKAVGFLAEQELNGAVSEMHAELLLLSGNASYTNDGALMRTFPHRVDPLRVLEISASILRRHPVVSLFVLRLKLRSTDAGSPPSIPE